MKHLLLLLPFLLITPKYHSRCIPIKLPITVMDEYGDTLAADFTVKHIDLESKRP